MVDAAVSKTVGSYIPCRFDSDLRHDVKPTIDAPLEIPGALSLSKMQALSVHGELPTSVAGCRRQRGCVAP